MKGAFRVTSGPLAKFGVVVIDDAVTPEFRRHLLERVQSADSVPAAVVGSTSSSGDTAAHPANAADPTPGIDVAVRRTRQLTVSRRLAGELDEFFAAIAPEVAVATGHPVTTAEPVSCLRYAPGDFFIAHRDSPLGAGARKVDQRLVSVVLFVNGHAAGAGGGDSDNPGESPVFTGGELVLVPVEDFVDLGVAVDPVPARLVLFPSTMVHEVKPVTSGDRFTVVTWYHA